MRPILTSRNLLLASAAVFALVAFGQLPGHSLLWQELQNSLHTLLFFILALLVLYQLRHHARLACYGNGLGLLFHVCFHILWCDGPQFPCC